jgi:actin-like ATPase involved in cell morphogenesis
LVAKVRERLAVSEQEAQKFDVERFNFGTINEEVRKQFQIKISKRSAALQNLSDSEDINRTWENVKDNIKPKVQEIIRQYKLKQHKPRLTKDVYDQKKLGKMQWLQSPYQTM